MFYVLSVYPYAQVPWDSLYCQRMAIIKPKPVRMFRIQQSFTVTPLQQR